MSYFPHAFQKMLLGTAGFVTTANTAGENIPAAKVAVIDPRTNKSVILTTSVTDIHTLPQILLSQGSIATVDKLAPFMGGYKESVKSKGISPRYVSRFWRHDGHAAQNQIMDVKMCDNAATLVCGTNYHLRVDVKGSPALRFLTHNLYSTFQAYTGCCPASPASQAVKPWTVIEQWGLGIFQHQFFKPFVDVKLIYNWTDSGSTTHSTTVTLSSLAPSVLADIEAGRPAGFTTGSNTVAYVTLRLTAAYAETKFGNCSFDPRDAYEMEPLYIYPSVTDDSGNPCTATGFCYTEAQAGYQATGSGETWLRKKLLSDSYMGPEYDWSRDPRLREVIDGNVNFGYIDRTKNDYVSYHILHSIPRKANPSGTMDNDQYLISILVAAASTTFETWFQAYLDLAGNGVTLETL